jgi:hypothetical protein
MTKNRLTKVVRSLTDTADVILRYEPEDNPGDCDWPGYTARSHVVIGGATACFLVSLGDVLTANVGAE